MTILNEPSPLAVTRCLLAFTATFGLFLGVANAVSAGGDRESTAVTVLGDGFTANRLAFNSFRCEFEVSTGKSQSVDDALAGKISNGSTRKGLWIVKDLLMRYDLRCDPALTKIAQGLLDSPDAVQLDEESGMYATTIPCSDVHILRNGEIGMRYAPIIGSVNLSTRNTSPAEMLFSPFGSQPESTDFGKLVSRGNTGELAVRHDGPAQHRGNELISVSVGIPGDSTVHCRYLVDPKRGFLPIFQWQLNPSTKKRVYDSYILETEEHEGGRWFPMRTVVVRHPESSPPYQVEEIRVVALDLLSVPRDEDFGCSLAPQTRVNVPGEGYFMTLDRETAVRASTLKDLYADCIAATHTYQGRIEQARALNGLGDARLPNRDSAKKSRITMAVVASAGILLTLVVILLVVRKNHGRINSK